MLRYSSFAALAFDSLALCAAWVFAVWLGRDFVLPDGAWPQIGQSLTYVLLTGMATMVVTRSYLGIWRFTGVSDALRLAVVAQSVVFVGTIFKLFVDLPAIRWSSGVISGALFIALALGARLSVRLLAERAATQGHRQRAIILGSGDAAALLIRELSSGGDYQPVAALDDNPQRIGRRLLGVEVLGRIDQLPEVARRLQAQVAIAAMPAALPSSDAGQESSRRAELKDLADAAGLRLLTVPPLADLMLKRANITQLRDINARELLNREPVNLSLPTLQAMVAGRRVMVTGGGGSIGSELVRQLVSLKPESVDVIDTSEFNSYQLGEALAHSSIRPVLHVANVQDAPRMRELFAVARPQVVLHAAAYKHVPLMEEGNCVEAFHNNVGGTLTVARLAGEFATERFVLVSTDKAVNPTNVMGATKRLAELGVQALARVHPGTVFAAVRFGNVLDSAGSVIPKFREQIAAGGPVTVTHPDIVRYFMSIPEAAQLVLTAASHAKGGEVFVLDMGEPVRIVDLAREMIRLAGLSEQQVPIQFTGLRPGEKLFEELLVDTERHQATPHPKIFVAGTDMPASGTLAAIARLLDRVKPGTSDDQVRIALQEMVPEYSPAVRQAAGLPAATPPVDVAPA